MSRTGLASPALMLVQLVLGYEWLASGASKLVRGDFPSGLAANLREEGGSAPGWYRGFLDTVVIAHARAFGYLIENSELLTGLALTLTAVAVLSVGGRFASRLARTLAPSAAAAALAGAVMAVNFQLARGGAAPWSLPAHSFDEAVDLDSIVTMLQLVLAAANISLFLQGRSARRSEPEPF